MKPFASLQTDSPTPKPLSQVSNDKANITTLFPLDSRQDNKREMGDEREAHSVTTEPSHVADITIPSPRLAFLPSRSVSSPSTSSIPTIPW
ncbi:hypothetical protein M8J76_009256 [Diaphorina citri]|nr:hypothetical protein M8J76_009256 [Diaphorina citri]